MDDPVCLDAVPCPLPCPSVFGRLLVDYQPAGNTRVIWGLLPVFTDPQPWAFQLQVGHTQQNDADDWEDVGTEVVDDFWAIDDGQRAYGKIGWSHYRVQLTTDVGVYYSDPEPCWGGINNLQWGLVQQLRYQHDLQLRTGITILGQDGLLLKRRWFGTPCTRCLDHVTGETRDPNCLVCYGTEILGGYFHPIDCVPVGLERMTYYGRLDGQRGPVQDHFSYGKYTARWVLYTGDVWVSRQDGRRYAIHNIDHLQEICGIPVVAQAKFRLLPFTDVAYQFPIEDPWPYRPGLS